MKLILRWLATAVAVYAATRFVPGIRYTGGYETLAVVALVLGLVNAFVRPLVKALACGLIVLTLGLVIFVINALMLLLAAYLARELGYGFYVDSFGAALVGSVVISLVSWALSIFVSDDRKD